MRRAELEKYLRSYGCQLYRDTHAYSVRAGRIFRTTREDLIRRVDVGEALGSGLRDGRRRDVIEEAVIFVVQIKALDTYRIKHGISRAEAVRRAVVPRAARILARLMIAGA